MAHEAGVTLTPRAVVWARTTVEPKRQASDNQWSFSNYGRAPRHSDVVALVGAVSSTPETTGRRQTL